jgi:hypothetical protein
MDLTHLHLLLNHVPTVGLVLALGLFLASLAWKSEDIKRASLVLFLGIALVTLATYVTGNIAQQKICEATSAPAPCNDPGVSKPMIAAHEGAAMIAFAFMQITGAFAWLGLWQFRRASKMPAWNVGAVALFAIISFGLMSRAANMGGEIRHPEIRAADEAPPPATTVDPGLARRVGLWVVGEKWVWPTCETLHFIGLSLLFGVATLVDLRMLGLMKGLPFPALHRILPWGILGFGINLITGMLFFIGAPGQYTQNPVFHWKLALMLLAGLNVLYFTIFDQAWEVGSGDDAPGFAKFVAASALVLVLGVLYCGRMLPFLGNAF